MPIDDVDVSKVVEDVHVLSKTASITKDISDGSDTLIIDEVHISFDSTNDDVNEIVEPNISHSSSLVLNIILWSFLSSHKSLEFLDMIE